MTYLIDTSALVRLLRRQVVPSWYDQVTGGSVVICEPVITETLTIARTRDYPAVLAALHETYPWVAVPDGAWDTVREVRARLAERSADHGLSVADHLVVATALHYGLTILHADADFATAASVVPELRQEAVGLLES